MLKDSLLKFFKIEGLLENLSGYVETKIELFKLEMREELTKSLAKLAVLLTVMLIFIIAIVFISTALALYIGRFLNIVAGFAIVGGAYLIMGFVLLLYREQINHRMEKKLGELVKQKKK